MTSNERLTLMDHEQDIPLEPAALGAPSLFGNRAPAIVHRTPEPSAISAARAGDLFDLLVAGTTAGGAAALTWMAYNTAFDGPWLLRLLHNPFSLKLLGLIFLAFGGFRIVALAFDQSAAGGIMRRTREIERRKPSPMAGPDNLRS